MNILFHVGSYFLSSMQALSSLGQCSNGINNFKPYIWEPQFPENMLKSSFLNMPPQILILATIPLGGIFQKLPCFFACLLSVSYTFFWCVNLLSFLWIGMIVFQFRKSSFFVCLKFFFKVMFVPNMGLQLRAPRSRVPWSSEWASQVPQEKFILIFKIQYLFYI